jgi:uncharacterized protein (TIGR02391 family)
MGTARKERVKVDTPTESENFPRFESHDFEDLVLYYLVKLTGELPVGTVDGVSEADIALHLTKELNTTSEFIRSGDFPASQARNIILAAIEELNKEGLVERIAVMGPWIIKPTRRGRNRVAQWHKEWEQKNRATSENPAGVQPNLRDAQETSGELAKLRRELQIAKQTLSSLITDDELRRRCEDLLSAERHYDRVIREACVILENRVRVAIRANKELVGTALMENAFGPRNGPLRFSNIDQEQRGLMEIYRGIMAFFRNTTGHNLIDTYSQDDALRFVAWIDLLLKMVTIISEGSDTNIPAKS